MYICATLIAAFHTKTANARPNVRGELRWGGECLFIDAAHASKTTLAPSTGTGPFWAIARAMAYLTAIIALA